MNFAENILNTPRSSSISHMTMVGWLDSPTECTETQLDYRLLRCLKTAAMTSLNSKYRSNHSGSEVVILQVNLYNLHSLRVWYIYGSATEIPDGHANQTVKPYTVYKYMTRTETTGQRTYNQDLVATTTPHQSSAAESSFSTTSGSSMSCVRFIHPVHLHRSVQFSLARRQPHTPRSQRDVRQPQDVLCSASTGTASWVIHLN